MDPRVTARTSESRQSAEALLSGAGGEAARLAMQMLVDLAKAVGAQGFLEISSAHVDGVIYTGPGEPRLY